MALAAVGLVIFLVRLTKHRAATIDNSLLGVSFGALLVSFAGFCSVTINNTNDYSYATYIISAWVWLGGAYTVIQCMNYLCGKATLRLLTNILAAVCVTQCILSQIIDSSPSFAGWVDSFMVSTGFMGKPDADRLYGIGCALDVAGLKFSAVLVLMSYFAIHPSGRINKYLEASLYVLSFLIVIIFGSIIARTTVVGITISLSYAIVASITNKKDSGELLSKYFWKTAVSAVIIFTPIVVTLYNSNHNFREQFRFGFEGFFALAETGEWNVRSNNQLAGMWRWPDNPKTYLIGDGYFEGGEQDPYYIGPSYGDFYMGTDIGYCRFIFYFGVIGLALFCAYFIACTKICSDNIPKCRIIFWLILAINFIGWAKVSTDIFPIFALMLMLDRQDIETPLNNEN